MRNDFIHLCSLLLTATLSASAAPTPEVQATTAPSAVPGIVIDHSPAASRCYIGSPSIAALPDGRYIASHDFFGPGTRSNQTRVFSSTDQGQTWTLLATIDGQFWSTLFTHHGGLYLIGTSKEYGFAIIRRSDDGGKTWTRPVDKSHGLLLDDGKYHCAPQPVVVHAGRIWRGMEDAMGPGGWGSHFRAFMMSAPVDADLLDAASWTRSNTVARDPTWLDGKFGGWLEGNAIVTPNGHIVDILRVDRKPDGETAAIVHVSDDGRTASFDHSTGFIHFPGGTTKFTIRFDDKSKLYWTLSNSIPRAFAGPEPGMTRNTLALASSPDLRNWSTRAVVLSHPDRSRHGFQYVDWLIEGDDLIAVSRTAYDDASGGAHNQHDANYLTFHRVKAFRDKGGS